MRFFTLLALIIAIGCAHPYTKQDRGPNSEWFIVVSTELTLAAHERFATELPYFVNEYAQPGDVIHVLAGQGIVAFTLRVPKLGESSEDDFVGTMQKATDYFMAGTHLDGHDSCYLDCGSLDWRMKQLRETNFRHPVILLGSEQRKHYFDFGCQCSNRPHSLLKEYQERRFHPEYRVKTKKQIDFEQEYGPLAF